MKLSKAAKARIKRMPASEKKKCASAARLLADCEMITPERCHTILRTLAKSSSGY